MIPIGKAKNIIGNQYNLLTPLFRVDGPNKKKTYFACQCDCGEYTVAESSHIQDGHTKSCGCLDHPNLIGQTFGYLTVVERANEKGNGVKWKCKCKCGRCTEVTTSDLLKGHSTSCGCKITTEQEKSLVNKKFGYLTCLYAIKKRDKNGSIIWHCKCDCGNEIDISRQSLITGNTTSCGCLISKGENKIKDILTKYNIPFETQKTFDTCRFPDTNALARFDFYLPQFNLLVEYDGEQHFHYQVNSTTWNNKENFEKTQKHDAYKNQWCKQNNIKLKRIPYWDYDKITLSYIIDIL
jgi:hypothetical protein